MFSRSPRSWVGTRCRASAERLPCYLMAVPPWSAATRRRFAVVAEPPSQSRIFSPFTLYPIVYHTTMACQLQTAPPRTQPFPPPPVYPERRRRVFSLNNRPTHAARQLESGLWTSKCGKLQDIQHETLQAIEGGLYGHPAVFLQRRRDGKPFLKEWILGWLKRKQP